VAHAQPVDLLKMGCQQLRIGGQPDDPVTMSQLSEDAAVRRLADRLGFGLAGEALLEAQQRGLTSMLEQYLSRGDGDAGVDQTPPPEMPWITRPKKVAGNRPAEYERKAWRQQMRQQREQLILWWLDRMVGADDQLRERATWFCTVILRPVSARCEWPH